MEAARARAWRPSEQSFSTVVWLDRTWILGEEIAPESFVVGKDGRVAFKQTTFRWFNGLAIDLEIAKRVFAYIEAEAPEAHSLENLPEFGDDIVEAAKQAGGAIFPDGFAVLGNEKDLAEFRPGSVAPRQAAEIVRAGDIRIATSNTELLSYQGAGYEQKALEEPVRNAGLLPRD